MQKRKTLEELLKARYLSKSDISRLFGLPWGVSVKVYELAKAEDVARLKGRIVYPTKVTIESALAVQGKNYNLLEKQIKGAPER